MIIEVDTHENRLSPDMKVVSANRMGDKGTGG